MTRTRADSEDQPVPCESAHLRRDALVVPAQARQLTPQMRVFRSLPQRQLRMIGPWCFVDHFGPVATADYRQFDIPPHPHIGLQTITWLLSGQLLHQDSLGYEQPLRAGELNLMTAGNGISHAEVAAAQVQDPLHGLQLWAALPEANEATTARFDHYKNLPQFALGECQATLVIGDYVAGERRYHSPALQFHPTFAMQLKTPRVAVAELQLEADYEYGLYVVSGRADLLGKTAVAHELLYLGSGRKSVTIELAADTLVMVIGGEAFAQPVQMWWNFVSSDAERIRIAQREWNGEHERFGKVASYRGERLLAPELPASKTKEQ
ncbi:pirin family protein [Pseudidiomarina insulisalsae]|uniref:Pirin family protein n=1 Tax=Pseudidiomarina insulisalsae TaxID=575789 RepID=A0A432YME9_9GAMM|nr:pirin family protein [Pseudidiomarina insulisalsae]RUO62144.1 pirin family protein [Pseudidiomarina insulisalsae]